ncbi:MAG: hypothetical protein CBC55_06850 [Gammaproteobacteria bacterium TMED95]|jgi:hypothetical protein|nr:hypothetical protein [Gammaproteobacteria bacterium]OUV21102.1 MAG: hypothetical protein CBC55_06850 [Gammaproteobacteria bacterium TMED95]
MRGRLQASGAAALASALPIVGWLGTAIVALVVLRQGLKDGLLVLLWAALPLVLIYQTGGDASGLAAISGVFLLAMVLRLTTSWELTLLAAVGVAAAGSWAFAILSAPILAAFAQWYVETLSALAADAGVAGVTLEEGKSQAISYLAMGQGYLMVLAVVLARWWQSVLFNPGGFKQEIRNVRLTPRVSGPLLIVVVLCSVTPGYESWVGLLAMPFVVAGTGLVHWQLAQKSAQSQWYIAYYMSVLLLFQWVSMALVALVLADGLLDLRQRMKSRED